MRGYNQYRDDSLIDYFQKEWQRSVLRLKRCQDSSDANNITIKYEEKHSNPVVRAPTFKPFDFEHFKAMKTAESLRPRRPNESGAPVDASRQHNEHHRTYIDSTKLYGDTNKAKLPYSDIAAKPVSAEKYQPPHLRRG